LCELKIQDENDLFVAIGTGLLLADDAPSANAKLVKSEKKKIYLNHSQKLMKSEKRNKKHVLEPHKR
jgi:hypothetical protein